MLQLAFQLLQFSLLSSTCQLHSSLYFQKTFQFLSMLTFQTLKSFQVSGLNLLYSNRKYSALSPSHTVCCFQCWCYSPSVYINWFLQEFHFKIHFQLNSSPALYSNWQFNFFQCFNVNQIFNSTLSFKLIRQFHSALQLELKLHLISAFRIFNCCFNSFRIQYFDSHFNYNLKCELFFYSWAFSS